MGPDIPWYVSDSRAFNGQPCPLLIAMNQAMPARGPCETFAVERHSSCLLLDYRYQVDPQWRPLYLSWCLCLFSFLLCMKRSSLCFTSIRLDFIRLSSTLCPRRVKWFWSGPVWSSWISLPLSSTALFCWVGCIEWLLYNAFKAYGYLRGT